MTDTTDERPMRERMLAGELYLADDPEIAEESAVALDLVAAYNATTARQEPLRRALLGELLGSLGEGTVLRPPVFFDYGTNTRIGAGTFRQLRTGSAGCRRDHHR